MMLGRSVLRRRLVIAGGVLAFCLVLLVATVVLTNRGTASTAERLADLANSLTDPPATPRGPIATLLMKPVAAAVESGRLAWRFTGRLFGVTEVHWDKLQAFREANAQLPPRTPGSPRVVFLGDSITADWDLQRQFPGRDYVNRGIVGNTTVEMLARFRCDVLSLYPHAVIIAGGINDLSGRWVPIPIDTIKDDYASMAELARLHGIRVVFASLPPISNDRGRMMTLRVSRDEIVALNNWLRRYCADSGFVYLDYYTALADAHGALRPELTIDGLHPNDAGRAVMAPLVEAAIDHALAPGIGPVAAGQKP